MTHCVLSDPENRPWVHSYTPPSNSTTGISAGTRSTEDATIGRAPCHERLSRWKSHLCCLSTARLSDPKFEHCGRAQPLEKQCLRACEEEQDDAKEGREGKDERSKHRGFLWQITHPIAEAPPIEILLCEIRACKLPCH